MADFHSIGGNEVVPHKAGGALLSTISGKADANGSYAALAAGSAAALTGGAGTDATLPRTSVADGVADVLAIKGNTVVWNQLVGSDTSSVTVPSGHKYLGIIGGTSAIATSDGTAVSVTGGTDQLFDLTQMFGSGNEPTTVAEFEALYPEAYYPYSAPTLLPVNIAGIKSVGFNIWDEVWEVGGIYASNGNNSGNTSYQRSKNHIPCLPSTTYYIKCPCQMNVMQYDANKGFISVTYKQNATFTTPRNCHFLRFTNNTANQWLGYNHNICINLSDPNLNGTYRPYMSDSRTFDAVTLRKAGSAADELTSNSIITRVGSRAYESGDESDTSVVTDGTTTFYALTTHTTTPIDPPLNLSYRTAEGGTESIVTAEGVISAPVTLTVSQGHTQEGVRDLALSAIAPVENHKASANYAVGSYIVHQGTLYKVTSAIASGESIVPGTNVTATTVMAELAAINA